MEIKKVNFIAHLSSIYL